MILLVLLGVRSHVVADRLHVVFGAAAIPHPAKVAKGGEDAFFFDDSHGTFGVADGVGGSASAEVDPGAFSREMLKRCHDVACGGEEQEEASRRSLVDTLGQVADQGLVSGGSSTLLLGQLEASSDPTGSTRTLRLLNLGDSGAMILRPAWRTFRRGGKQLWPRIVLRTQDQQHFFNCPYQADADSFGSVGHQADKLCADVQDGDIFIAATDGVLDNLFDPALQVLVARSLPGLREKDPLAAQTAVDALAKVIAEQANAAGLREDDPELRTPFMVAAAQEGLQFAGGKLDDVAVVCGVVRCGEAPPQRVGHNFGSGELGDVRGVVVSTASRSAVTAKKY